MKKTLLLSCMLLVSTSVFAAEVFTPISQTSDVHVVAAAQSTQNQVVSEEALGNDKIQSAIAQVDNAQVEIRNQLLDLKTKYADVDAKYSAIKAERKVLHKQLKTAEKRLKSLERSKEAMRKNML